MKFIKISESNAHGNPNLYEFHVGLEEMKLMLGLLVNYFRWTPKGKQWLPEGRRAKNMINALKKHLDK